MIVYPVRRNFKSMNSSANENANTKKNTKFHPQENKWFQCLKKILYQYFKVRQVSKECVLWYVFVCKMFEDLNYLYCPHSRYKVPITTRLVITVVYWWRCRCRSPTPRHWSSPRTRGDVGRSISLQIINSILQVGILYSGSSLPVLCWKKYLTRLCKIIPWGISR